jgi:hypothetical protein
MPVDGLPPQGPHNALRHPIGLQLHQKGDARRDPSEAELVHNVIRQVPGTGSKASGHSRCPGAHLGGHFDQKGLVVTVQAAQAHLGAVSSP